MENCGGISVKVESTANTGTSGSRKLRFPWSPQIPFGLICVGWNLKFLMICIAGDSKSNSRDVKFSPPSTQSLSSMSFQTTESTPATPKSEGQILLSSSLKVFSFNDLKCAARNFRPDSVLGKGVFGCVFKGWIDEQGLVATKPGAGMGIAVKKLNQEGLQGHKKWLLSHPNLVKLIAYCTENEQLLLVYEFMPKGSLDNHLFRRDSYYQPLSWAVRIKVALGAAKGPAFLHNLQRQVIHHDFTASNILLDSIYNAKLSDFGLAKDVPNWYDDMHVWTSIRGSYGYAAPEYVATGHLTVKSDVYGFGVVLLELLSGLRAVDTNQPAGQHNLVEWAKPNLGDKYKIYHVIDHQLEGQFPPKEAYEAAMLALQCLNTQARHRPHMKEIVERLEWLQAIKDGARIQSIANGSGNVSPRNMNYPSPGRPKQAGSPLPSYQCSPRQQ